MEKLKTMFKIKIKERKLDKYIGKKVAYCYEYFNIATAEPAATITGIEDNIVFLRTTSGGLISYTIPQLLEYLSEGSWMIIEY